MSAPTFQDVYPSRLPASAARPTLSERVDPVVYDAAAAARRTSAAWVEGFERDGFAVLPELFSPTEVEQLRADAIALRERRDLLPGTVITEPGEDDATVVRSVFAIHLQSEALRRLAADPRLAGLAQDLLGDDVYIHQSRLNYKPGFRGKEFYWHSDFETWHCEDGMPRMRAVSMSVLLTDNHEQAGPTMFVPGSHRRFVACVGETPDDHYKHSLRKQEIGVPGDDALRTLVAEGGIVAPAPKAGTVVVFDCNVMHGSNGNITPFERNNAFLVFNAWSNRLVEPFAAKGRRPEFAGHRERVTRLERNRI